MSDNEQSNPTAQLYAALAKAQGQFKPIIPDRKVKVSLRAGGSYEFRYATLGAVIEATREGLSSNGLSLISPIDEKGVTVRLCHESGACIDSSLPLPRGKDWQAYGSDVTYVRRYLTSALLGVASEYDDDGNRGAGNEVEPQGDKLDLWSELDKAGVPTEPRERRAWCERVLQRDLPNDGSIRDVDIGELLAVARKDKPMPPPRPMPPTQDQIAKLNAALDKLEPWGAKSLEGLDPKQAAARQKNAKLAWISAMLQPPRRVASSGQITAAECSALTTAASNGEMPAVDPLQAWLDTAPKETAT